MYLLSLSEKKPAVGHPKLEWADANFCTLPSIWQRQQWQQFERSQRAHYRISYKWNRTPIVLFTAKACDSLATALFRTKVYVSILLSPSFVLFIFIAISICQVNLFTMTHGTLKINFLYHFLIWTNQFYLFHFKTCLIILYSQVDG